MYHQCGQPTPEHCRAQRGQVHMGWSPTRVQRCPEWMPYQLRSHILRFPMAPGLPTSSLALPGLCVSTHSCPLGAGPALLLLSPAAALGLGLGLAGTALPAGPAGFFVGVAG